MRARARESRLTWLAPERISDERLEEITRWLEENRYSQWYGEASIYIEELLCDRLAILEKPDA